MSIIPSQRHLFSIPEDHAYLNCATTSPLAAPVLEAGMAAMREKATPWRITADMFHARPEGVRERFARLLATSPDNVALVPGVSYGIALAANTLPLATGQSVVVLQDQFPSNIYAWRKRAEAVGARIVTVPRPADFDWTTAVLEHLTPDTGIAALPHCHWTDGSRLDLATIGARCRELGASLAVDASQSLGAMPFDLDTIRPDFLATAGHKWLFGAYGYSYLYVDPKWHEAVQPLEENWLNREGSEDPSRLVEYRDGYRPGVRKLDFGECSSFLLTPVSSAALDLILDWGVENIAETLAAHTTQIVDRARELGLGTIPDSHRSPHMTGIMVNKPITVEFVRAFKQDNVFLSLRGQSIRIAPHVYTVQEDLDRLFRVLEKHVG